MLTARGERWRATVCIIGKDKLVKLIEDFKVVYPYDYNLLDGDSYVLTVK